MRSLRFVLLALTISIVLLVLAAASTHGASAATVGTASDSLALPSITSVCFGSYGGCLPETPQLCPGRPIPVHIEGLLPPGCWFVRKVVFVFPVETLVPTPPTVRVLLDNGACVDSRCSTTPVPWSVDTMLPGLPSRRYELPVQLATVACSDSILPGTITTRLHPFVIADSCAVQVLPVPPGVLLAIVPPQPCPGDPVAVRVAMRQCSPCERLLNAGLDESGLTVRYVRDSVACRMPDGCTADTVVVGLGLRAAGAYTLATRQVEIHLHPDGSADSLVTTGQLAYTVGGPSCPTTIHPIPLDARVSINGHAVCDSCPPAVVCAAKPIPVRVTGVFPSGCGHVAKVELLPSITTLIGPPTLRILLDSDECRMIACPMHLTPWVVDTVLPALPAGAYRLPVQIAQVSCSDTILPGRIASQSLPFVASPVCSLVVGKPCFFTAWGPELPGTTCNTFVSPGHPGDVEMLVRSNVSLAGLQGVLHAGPSVMITEVVGIGPAAGMNVEWGPTADGARFVMFATSGAPIPGMPFGDTLSRPVPVLRVTVGLVPGLDSRLLSVVRADSLLGADSLAGAVTPCPDLTMRPIVAGAQVCIGTACDVNGDGRSDVRDLVLMVHCILGGGVCPDTVAGRHDCNGDGKADLDDILCCARTILMGMPHDSLPGRSDPGIAVHFGVPRVDGDQMSVPLTLEGADRVGALRMALSYPSDRYTVSGLRSDAGAGWLALDQVESGDVVLGLIALTPPVAGASVPLTLDLVLKPGQEHGGEVSVTSADVSAPDGVSLATQVAGAATPLATPTSAALAIRPNPLDASGATVVFALPRAATVDLAVYDIAGRRMATLAHGPLVAGSYSRTWDASGARDGVYFVRLRADGVELAHKAVLRRGR